MLIVFTSFHPIKCSNIDLYNPEPFSGKYSAPKRRDVGHAFDTTALYYASDPSSYAISNVGEYIPVN